MLLVILSLLPVYRKKNINKKPHKYHYTFSFRYITYTYEYYTYTIDIILKNKTLISCKNRGKNNNFN